LLRHQNIHRTLQTIAEIVAAHGYSATVTKNCTGIMMMQRKTSYNVAQKHRENVGKGIAGNGRKPQHGCRKTSRKYAVKKHHGKAQ